MGRLQVKLPHEIFARRPRIGSHPGRLGARTERARVDGLLAPGTIVDKYRIEELLGTGGFGAVYRATHLLLRSTVALKHLRADVLARRPELVGQLLDEARWAARIHHPSVMRVFDVTESPALTYVVMEYIAGDTLARALDARGCLSPDEVARIGVDVAEGLAAGLDEGLVHRDIKPANIVLARDGRARIVDLGLACLVEKAGTSAAASPSGMVGTRGYAAPEQLAEPHRADFRSDVYSLGVTLDEALRGRRRSAATLAPNDAVARALARFLGRMMAHAPRDRPASYPEIVLALRAARESK